MIHGPVAAGRGSWRLLEQSRGGRDSWCALALAWLLPFVVAVALAIAAALSASEAADLSSLLPDQTSLFADEWDEAAKPLHVGPPCTYGEAAESYSLRCQSPPRGLFFQGPSKPRITRAGLTRAPPIP